MAYSDEVLADTPVGYWRLDETSGTSAADSSGNARPGTYVGSPTLGGSSLLAAGGGTAVALNGTSQRITRASHADFNITNATAPFTFECWVKLDNPSAASLQILADKTNVSTSNSQWVVYWDNRNVGAGTVNALRFRYNGSAVIENALLDWAGSGAAAALGAGGHLACVATSTDVYIYWNGTQVATSARVATSISNTTQTLSFGARSDGSGFWFDGTLDEIAIYQSALSAMRVAAHYDAGAGSTGLAGSVASTSTVEGAITATFALDGAVAALSGVEGAFESGGTVHDFAGQVDAVSGSQGSLALSAALAGTVAATSGVVGSFQGDEAAHIGLRVGLTSTDSAVTLSHSTATIGLRVGLTATDLAIDAIETAHIGVRIGLRTKETRDWGLVAGDTRPTPRVVLAHRDGTPVASLGDDVTISPVTSGVGVIDSWRFSVDRDDEQGRKVDPVALEAHIYRGSVLMSKGPIGPGRLDGGRMLYDVADPRWYLYGGRRIGRVPKLDWCYNGDFALGTLGWSGAYEAGSAPEAAPVFEVVDEAESTSGKGLRIEGVDKVVTAKDTVQTAAVFYPNRPYASESYPAGFLSGGQQAIIDVANKMTGPAPVVHVVGHTADADSGTGQALSERRALWAKNVILSVWPSAVVTTEGKGETQPIATNSTLEGQAKNRRVEIFYSSTQTATGHRQYVKQTRAGVTQPVDAKVPLEVTVAGRMRIGEWLGAPKDGWALWIGLYDSTGTLVGDPGTASMSEATPRERWHDYSASVEVPADGATYSLEWRLYPPAGWAVWSDIAVYPEEQLGFFDVDQALIVKALTEHVQDTAMGKGDLGIGTRTPVTGITRTREYPFHERKPYGTALDELVALARGVEVDCEVTPNSATIVTHYPRQGGVAGVTLAHGGPRSIVKAYRPLPASSEKLASSVIVQAWGISATRREWHARDEAALGGTLLEAVIEAEGETPPSELDELTVQHLARSIHPRAAWEVDIDPARTSEFLDAVGKGDVVFLSLPDEGVHALHRMVLQEWDPETDALTLQLAPEEA